MSVGNVPALSQKKYTCDLRDLLRGDDQSQNTAPAQGTSDQYDAFIFKDGFTQSSYTFHKLKGQKKTQKKQHEMLHILGNIKKYRNHEILKRVKEKQARVVAAEQNFIDRMSTTHKKPGLEKRPSTIDGASREFFRQYLYSGSHFSQKQRTEDRLRRMKTTEVSSSESEIDEPQGQGVKERIQRRKVLDQRYEDQFAEKYAEECKQIESDLKIIFGQIPRHLIQPQNKSQTAMSVRSCVRRHHKLSQQTIQTCSTMTPNTLRRSFNLIDLPSDTAQQATFALQNSNYWFNNNNPPPSPTNNQNNYFLKCVKQSRVIQVESQLMTKQKLIRCRDNKGNNALHVAAKNSDLEIVQILVKKGCDPHAQNYFGKKPLDIARHFDNEDVVNYLKKLRPRV